MTTDRAPSYDSVSHGRCPYDSHHLCVIEGQTSHCPFCGYVFTLKEDGTHDTYETVATYRSVVMDLYGHSYCTLHRRWESIEHGWDEIHHDPECGHVYATQADLAAAMADRGWSPAELGDVDLCPLCGRPW